MWFWQRKEVWAGLSMQEFSRVREVLAGSGVRYDYRLKSRQRFEFDRRLSGLGRMGSDPRYDTMYYVYVRKEEWEHASRLLEGRSD